MTHESAKQIPSIAYEISSELAKVEGVVAVVLGGSWAKDTATKDSDIDLAIYYNANNLPSLESLKKVIDQIADDPSDNILTDFGGWGPWINGGGWINVKNHDINLLYSNLEQIRHHVQETLEDHSKLYKQPGHPHGFHTHMYAGQIHIAKILYDPRGEIAKLKAILKPYPVRLKAFLIQEFSWQADFALAIAKKAVSRADIFYITACFVECAACLIQVLFALNETFWINEKGAIEITKTFILKPTNFNSRLEQLLANVGTNAKELEKTLHQFKELLSETRELNQS
jgi:predicted nucleotidyltransferase